MPDTGQASLAAQSALPHATRDALLTAAVRLFSEKGYAAVGIREIADAAGANIASIKYHFGSKSDLYIAAVRQAMSHEGEGASGGVHAGSAWEVLRDPPADARTAALRLARFIHQFLRRLMLEPSSSACCSLMVREAMEPSEAIDAVVRDYIQPHNALLVQTVSALAPHASPRERQLAATSVLAQVLHFRVFRAFAERLMGGLMDGSMDAAVDEEAQIRALARHIARFSLTALRCDESVIDEAVESISDDARSGMIEEGVARAS